MPETTAEPVTGGKWTDRFLANVIWSWIGVLASFFTGFFLSPYIVRKLGDQRYGIWALAFAFIDYFTIFDFGFKTAVINRIAGKRAHNDIQGVNEVISTAVFHFLGIGLLILTGSWFIAGQLHLFFHITPAYQADFAALVRIIGVGWAAAISMTPFQGALEGFQLFKDQSRIYIMSLILRSAGCAIALYYGYGLVAMGVIVTVSQFLSFMLVFVCVRRAFPMRVSPSLVRREVWWDLAVYGAHAVVATMGTMLLNQGPAILIGHFRSEAFVGYFALPSRLLQYIVEMVTRIGFVAMPNTADLAAQGRHQEVVSFSMYLNRYCLALFLPLCIFLLVYGREVFVVWVGPNFANQSAPLLPVFVISTAFAVAAQFNTSVVLFGLAKHQTYGKALLAEGVLVILGMIAVLPTYGILGAAWVSGVFAILDRGLFVPFLLSRILHFSLWRYLLQIYKPLLAAIPIVPYAFWLQSNLLSGRNWIELLTSLSLIAVPFYTLCFFTAVETDHRLLLQAWLLQRFRLILPSLFPAP